jgi:hypothetical protein
MNMVFSEEWCTGLHRRFDHQPLFQRTQTYFLACSPEQAPVRDYLEAQVANFPARSQERIIAAIRGSDNYAPILAELVVGSQLWRRGFVPEYEREFGELTPDWYVTANDRTPAFVVEVYSPQETEQMVADSSLMSELLVRFRTVKIGAAIAVSFVRGKFDMSKTKPKSIVQQTAHWLRDARPDVGQEFSLPNGVKVKVIGLGDRYTGVQCISTSPSGYWDDGNWLRGAISGKVSKYKMVLETHQLPFVVALVPYSFRVDWRKLEDVLAGTPAVEITYDKSTRQILGQRPFRKDDGLFQSSDSLLSAVALAERTGLAEWRLRLAFNPQAAHPLPSDTFKGE